MPNEQKITVLHFCEHFGGAQASLHGVARAFQWWIPGFDSSRFRILLCSRKGRDKAAEQMEAGGLAPMYLGYGKADPRNLPALMRIVKNEQVDIIHAHGFGACAWGRVAGLLLKKPVIVHGRCNYHTVPAVMRPIERVLGPMTRYAFAVSESTRRYTIEKRHIPEDVVKVLYNGILLENMPAVDDEWIKRFRAENGVSADGKVAGVVGRIVSHKGHLDTFRAVQALARDVPNIRLWVLGDGDYMPVLRQWLKDNAFEDHVRLFGFRRDVMTIIRCFDVQIFPSHFEGTPNTLFEAMAVGNCIVAAPTDGQGEILNDEDTALMYKLGDSDDMARQLKRALTDAPLASRLKGNALARSKDFDGRKCIEIMERTYEEIMQTPPNG
ncbi:glycosyltransferase family 4 protein [Verrucomicrobiota bacterium]